MTALKRSSKSPRNLRAGEQRAGVEREDLDPLQRVLHIVGNQPLRQPFGHRGLADARIADEHRIVLAAAAEDFDRALEFRGPADQRIELSLARAIGQVHAVGGERVARRGGTFVAFAGPRGRRRRRPAARQAASCVMPCEMYSSTSRRVMPCAASSDAA